MDQATNHRTAWRRAGESLLALLALVPWLTQHDDGPPRAKATAEVAPGFPLQERHAPLPVDLCARAIEVLRQEGTRPDTQRFDLHRGEILGRARAVPVVFRRAPTGPGSADPRAGGLREELALSPDPAPMVLEILRRTRRQYALRRQIFLSEGYLYADEPHLALRLSQVLRLDHLFDAPRLVVHRGAQVLHAQRSGGVYYWQEDAPTSTAAPIGGPETRVPQVAEPGTLVEANLLLFDRVFSEGEALPDALHADFSDLRERLHFDSAQVEVVGPSGWLVRLTTAGLETWGLVRAELGQVRLECESRRPGDGPALLAAREERGERRRLLRPILGATTEIVARRLPFDEPRTEEGQQDGLLRIHFRKAYREGKQTYEFNGDRYFVFDGFGRPLLPQVCIDFITDALDWGTGGHWARRGEGRVRVRGALDFKSFGLENPRSVEQVAEFAATRPTWFDMVFLSQEQRIKFVYRSRFFEQLEKDRGLYQQGDVVFILGLRDDERFHYHSFFIQEVDPVTGLPTLLAANAGPPQFRTWEGEMSNAPLRSIVARLRLRTSLLRQARDQVAQRPGQPLVPPEPTLPVDPAEARDLPSGEPERLDGASDL